MNTIRTIAFERIKSTDFPLQCRAMYYFSKGKHDHQTRKVSEKPYYIHPRGVAFIVMMSGGTIDQINAAFAHDLLEDTDTSFMEIAVIANSQKCAEICSELRNNKHSIREVGKTAYMSEKLVKMSDDALLVKLADILYNMSDNPTEEAKNRMYINVIDLIQDRGMSGDKEKEIPENCMKIIEEIKRIYYK